jgi:DNA-binding GntR family transcriptional regulator
MPREAMPPYQRIAADIESKIRSGELRSGEQVIVAELMERHGVSRNTILRAFKLLADRGLIETSQGWGTFVVLP